MRPHHHHQQDHAHHIARLINAYRLGHISVEQSQVLEEWINASAGNKKLFEQLMDDKYVREHLQWLKELNHPPILKRRYRAAAIIVSLTTAAAAIFFVFINIHEGHNPIKPLHNVATEQIQPGNFQATLTTANGISRTLRNISNDTIKFDDKSQSFLTGTRLIYNEESALPVMHTLSTRNGAEFQLELADGTRVWLNAGSSIVYPTAFTEDDRTVTVSGEVYFEVAKQARPFIVRQRDNTIKVLGTKFNLHDYPGEQQTLSLLEGKVDVSTASSHAIIRPGEKATITAGEIIVTTLPSIDTEIAWTKGLFYFNDASITDVMNQVSRWYDVSVQYPRPVQRKFSGQFKRNSSLAEVIEMLERSGNIQINIHERTLTVRSK